ncbi:Inosine-5'-monophosphate dehydrogenase [uncultured archaeon]|nr:Inosine-5'-monophosphate dehydrogenase [uncultured archaeon]
MENWTIPLIELGDLKVKLLQGGMGVGISGAGLASAVANEGGLGVIAAVGLMEARGYQGNYVRESNRALRDEIRTARSKMNGSGGLGVNVMHVLTNYSDLVRVALEENVDVIVSGAGIPRDLPAYAREVGNTHTKLVPIVSSAKLAGMMCKSWSKYNHLPDAIVVEGPKAGGHLGYSSEQLSDPNFVEHGLETIVQEVVEAVKPFEAERKIPIIAGGGIFYGGDIKRFLDLGASGVQMATRFVTTDECDADIGFKQEYLKAKKEDIVIIQSPVGMPGRALKSDFLREVEQGMRKPVQCPYHCLKSCSPKDSPYCIAKVMVDAQKGKFENGYTFVGQNAWRCNEIVPVKIVFEQLNQEYLNGKVSD